MKVVVIGGGPAGMMAAISSATNGQNEVMILEKMEMLGKKLLITGKGRCNITSSLPIEEFMNYIPGNSMFLHSSFHHFDNHDIIELLKQQGVSVKEERGNRIFPASDKSKDVQEAFIKKLKQLHVKVQTNARVKHIIAEEGQVTKVLCDINGREETIIADKVILATGGKSYPGTGSTGDGYRLAEEVGHHCTEIRPSLVPLVASKRDSITCKKLQGLSLRNVGIRFKDTEKGKVIYEDFGEMLFTHFGVSGPTILSGSAYILRYPHIDNLLKDENVKLIIDLKPALSEEKLDERVLRDFEENKNKAFRNSLDKLLPKKMIDVVIELSKINPNKKVNEITKKERENLVHLLKNFEITICNFGDIETAIVTSGGINIKEINPKTMESKLVKGLFFAGEIIDVDAYTGGFNLQIAYSTGYTAGMEI